MCCYASVPGCLSGKIKSDFVRGDGALAVTDGAGDEQGGKAQHEDHKKGDQDHQGYRRARGG
ncbi:hypothetical protein H5P28_11690 [Ruficoccus amylovorans]|uniref:Uncharacterized protein n=1 Tax=Ruficoccus amylovorans TaxID=1804625 RepID=A0A842HF76_9BACT|nr:hypothetical protein [Ruficoccus amylovorans]MBC2594919.1 hypothetical protein [Ruficoccus amylovorans]